MDSIALPPDLERFASEAVATGQYSDVGAVVAAGVSLLRHRDQARAAFIQSLDEAAAEGERDGFHDIEDVLIELDAIIEEEAKARS